MRTILAAVMAAGVLLVPTPGKAQMPQLPAGAPILFSGAYYYPSGPTVFFDGSVMVLSGSYGGVPIYVDATREPFHVVYVPVPGKLMRPYERRRDDEAADMVVASPAPGPVPLFPAAAVAAGTGASTAMPVAQTVDDRFNIEPRLAAGGRTAYTPTSINSIPPPRVTRGIWIEFDGRRWEVSGRGPASTSTLANVGSYHGFPVFQDQTHRDRIFVPSVADGPLVEYALCD
jgi:hypothetical protein